MQRGNGGGGVMAVVVVGGRQGVHQQPSWSQSSVDSAFGFCLTSPERGVTKESFGSKQEKEAVKRAANIRSL